MTNFDLCSLFSDSKPLLDMTECRRGLFDSGNVQGLLDSFHDARCLFLRVTELARFSLSGGYRLVRCVAGGWLFLGRDVTAPTYWLPVAANLRRLDEQGHILEERAPELEVFDLGVSGVSISFGSIPNPWTLDAVIWRLEDAALVDELQGCAPIETQGYFLLGSHTRYGRPADVYRHLVHGWVYEDRYAWPFKRRICSENDAHALHLIMTGLQRSTGKRIYGLLKAQLLLSLLARQSPEGGWRHGEWTQDMEAHYRLNTSALHLLMDAWSESHDPVIGTAMQLAAEFLADQRDPVAGGAWFLHDELEHDILRLNKGPFRWLKSRAFGKAESNMLVLNTQLDITVALDRFRELTGDVRLADHVHAACLATREVLAARPAEWLYRPLFKVITLTMLPTAQAAALPLSLRALKRLAWKYLIPRLPDIKVRFPRLVMPGGYVDRELCVRTWAHHYLSINLMDLARHQRRLPDAATDQVIHDVLRFAAASGIVLRWKELKYEKYALGFWAEALYHVCRLYPDNLDYRRLLAQAMLHLADLALGLPPSLLGANDEAVPADRQMACPTPSEPGILVANLGDAGRPEVLLVNCGPQSSLLTWIAVPCKLGWRPLMGGELAQADTIASHAAWLGTAA